MEEDGFRLVSRKKAARAPIPSSRSSQIKNDYEGLSTAEILTRLSELKQVAVTAAHSFILSSIVRHKLQSEQFFKDTIGNIFITR